MLKRKLKVFISSPFLELKEHRDAIKDIVDGWKEARPYEIRTGEKLYDVPGTTADQLRAWVDECNVFVLLLGAGYGSICKSEKKSFTHIEVDHAIERHKNSDLRAFFYFRVLDGKPVDPKTLNAHARQWNEMSDAAEQAAGHCKDATLATIQLRVDKALQALVETDSVAQSRDPDHRPSLDGKDYTYHNYTGLVGKVFVGRERQIAVLTDFAAKQGDHAQKSVLVVEALGGTGKSAMTWKWYNEPSHDCFKGYDMRMRWCFYEAGAGFGVFIEHLYALLWQQPLEWAREKLNSPRRAEYLNSILQDLRQRPVLLLLDGLEREFVSHRDAESLENESVSAVASVAFGTAGKGAGAKKSAGHTMQDGSGRYFIEQLASLRASRVVVTTRFTPNELTDRGTLLDGAEIMKLGLFTGDDRVHGVELLERRGIRAPYQSLVKLVDQCGGHPLTLQIVAAEVLRLPHNGDLIEFLRDNPGFEPPFDDVVQKRTHVLDYSLRNLGEVDWDVLHVLNINANNGPMERDEIVREVTAVSAAKRKAIVDSLRALHTDRALLEYSQLEDAYEMHPVVRGTVRRRLAERTEVLEKHEKVVGDIAATAGRGDDAGYYRMAATEDGRRQLNKLISIKLERGQLDAAAPMAGALASVLAQEANYFGAIELLLPFLDPDTIELSLTDGDAGVDVTYVLSDALRMVGQYTLAQVLLSRTIEKAETEKLDAKLPNLIELRALCVEPHGRLHDYHRDMKRALQLRAEKAGSATENPTQHAHLVRMLSHVFAKEGRTRLSQLALARASRLERGHHSSLSHGAIGFTRGTRTELLLRAGAAGERSEAFQSLLLQSRFANHDDGWLKWNSRAYVIADWSRSWAAWNRPHGMDDADFRNAWAEAIRDYTCFDNLKSASGVRRERARAFLDSGKPEDARRDLVAARADFVRHGDEKSSSIASLLALEARHALVTGERATAKTKAVEAIRWCADLGQISRGWMPLEDAIAVALQAGGRDLSVGDLRGAIEVDGRRYDFAPLFPWTEDEINPKDQHWVDPALILPVQLY